MKNIKFVKIFAAVLTVTLLSQGAGCTANRSTDSSSSNPGAVSSSPSSSATAASEAVTSVAATSAPASGSASPSESAGTESLTYPVADTGVTVFYSNDAVIAAPAEGEPFYGQDAQYQDNLPSYTDNGDGTVTDNVTGLMWQKDMGVKISYDEAFEKAASDTTGGYSDWRVPTIKELYSLILFTGQAKGETFVTLFIDSDYFLQPIGDTSIGEREIDAQTWSSTEYAGVTMNGQDTVFGVNFIDGRIKGYPKYSPADKEPTEMYFRLVRDNTGYGKNNFVDNGDGTISDLATGLMWQTGDSAAGMDWESALEYASGLTLAGNSDWRLPSAKELQSIVDYSRSLTTTRSAAIDPMFTTTPITNPLGETDYPYFWTGTTHLTGNNPYSNAAYLAFGQALGQMNGKVMDVHGAGAQRSDPKSGDQSRYPQYLGPQGDLLCVYNFVRCVRTIEG